MNSIRPLATVAVLAVVGVGLYMVINTSEPVPPEEAADALLEIGQIEDDLQGLVDEGMPSPYAEVSAADATAVPPFSPGDELTPPPSWSPPVENSPPGDSTVTPPGVPTQSTSGVAAPPPSYSTGESPAGAGNSAIPDGATNPFSAQLANQASTAPGPQDVANPYAQTTPASPGWGDIPSPADAAPATTGLDVAAGASPAATPFSIARNAIEETLHQGNLSQALLMLSEYYGDPLLTRDESAELEKLLSQLAGTVIYSTEHELESPLLVQPGETLADIAARYHVTPELLAKINGIADPNRLSPGSELKVVRGPFHAVLDSQGLRLLLDGRYAGRFAAHSPTVWEGETWTVQHKVPASAAPSGPGGAAAAGKQILLTPQPSGTAAEPVAILTIPASTSHEGPAVYVSAQDMDDLYDILTVGSQVTVRR